VAILNARRARALLRGRNHQFLPVPLLPPIELQPPSPPQTIGPVASGTGHKPAPLQPDAIASGSLGATLNTVDSLWARHLFKLVNFYVHVVPTEALIAEQVGRVAIAFEIFQSASLRRVAAATAVATTEASGQGRPTVPGRNSQGDLKIPARISQGLGQRVRE
jgi:serine/arginine repetitive matrix protein 2